MKKNVIMKGLCMLSFGLVLSVGAMAQGRPQGGQVNAQELAERQAEQMKKQLNLSDDQVAKLNEINKNAAEAMQALRNDQSMDRQAKMEKMQSLRAEREEAIKAMLTAEQQQKYATMQQNQNNRQGQGQRQGRGRGGN